VEHYRAFSYIAAIYTFAFMLLANSAAAQDGTSSELPADWIPKTATGLFVEPPLLKRLVRTTEGIVTGDAEPRDGLYAEMGNMVSGEGWISAGPGYRRHLLDGRALIDMSAAVSWNLYKTLQVQFQLPHLASNHLSVGAQAMYQDLLEVHYYGLGNDSTQSGASGYRYNNFDLLGYATVRANQWLSINARGGYVPRPDLSTATGRNVIYPNTLDLFTDATAPGLTSPAAFLHGDVSLVVDRRDHAGHPTTGGLYSVTATQYSDRDTGTYSFRRYEVEASQFIPLGTPNWILALHGWEVFSDTTRNQQVPFYLMPSLGGKNTLRGYHEYRFHDHDMQVFSAESRWALFSHVDAAGFVDVGKVAALAGDLNFKQLKRSYGGGLRVHNATSTLVRLDVGHSVEGWRIFVKVTDPFKRSTPASGRSAVVPFVP
jgi:hypothetical protein